MPFGPPDVSCTGHPAAPCSGPAGLGVRQATRVDTDALVAHFLALEPEDRWMRFCATLNAEAIRRHVDGLWDREGLVLAACEGPPFDRAGPVRALAELMVEGDAAELGISVEAGLRRRGIATHLLRTGAGLLASRGIGTIRATTLPDNGSFIALAQSLGGGIEQGPDLVAVTFDVAALAGGLEGA
jgi:ribosomal protein S18 acetylase RimI-like enzyme